MIDSHKQNLVVLASLTLLLTQSNVGSALPGLGLLKKDKPAKTDTKPTAKVEVKPIAKTVKAPEAAKDQKDQPIVSERLKAAAQNLIAARKQVSVAQAQLKAAEAEYRVAKFELGAISLRKQANTMANSSSKSEIAHKSTETSATNERIEAPASLGMGDLMPSPAPAKPTLAPAPGWNKPSDEVSIDDLDLP
ncbi:MAG: hypothetical protein K2Y22_05285 [Candidatus Obscuribacterales bacterium]|nr:hypothetical protein [Candidatus Obscuribacterales bacterium]